MVQAAAIVFARQSTKGHGPSVFEVSSGRSSRTSRQVQEVINDTLPCQERMRAWYLSKPCQILIAVIICASFICSAAEAQILPAKNSDAAKAFSGAEITFNVMFSLELAWNLYGHWFLPFFTIWNIFDIGIVGISWVAAFIDGAALPGVSVLRLLRAFRVFRLFKRVEALALIVKGVTLSLPGIANASLLALLTMGIWSIIAVDQFTEDEFKDYFGNFGLAMLTTLQMTTFDSWVSGVARPVITRSAAKVVAPMFFITYAIVSSFIMVNVVVAVLLDKYTEVTANDMIDKAIEEEQVRRSTTLHTEHDTTSELALPRVIGGALTGHKMTVEARRQAPGGLRAVEQAESYAEHMEERLMERLERLSNLLRMMEADVASTVTAKEELRKSVNPQVAISKLAETLAQERVSIMEYEVSRRSEVGGATSGRSTALPTSSSCTATECESEDLGRGPAVSHVLPGQLRLRVLYQGTRVQVIIAIVIFVNFLVSAVHAQVVPDPGTPLADAFNVSEWLFNTFFLVELLVNLYAHWCLMFWLDPWNVFDVFIVSVSWVAMLAKSGGVISVMRLFRAFRVFRLFKRVEALRIIIVGVFRALPGVSNAFVLLTLIMGIWSIIGVDMFRDRFPDEFGNFSKAMLTMFQIMTFDSWCSGIARPVILGAGSDQTVSILFFVSYVLLSGIIMANVVLAILLDKFLEASKEVEMELQEEHRLAEQKRIAELLHEQVVRHLETHCNNVTHGRTSQSSEASTGPVFSSYTFASNQDSIQTAEDMLADFLKDGSHVPVALLSAEWHLTARMAEVEAMLADRLLSAPRPPSSRQDREPSKKMNRPFLPVLETPVNSNNQEDTSQRSPTHGGSAQDHMIQHSERVVV